MSKKDSLLKGAINSLKSLTTLKKTSSKTVNPADPTPFNVKSRIKQLQDIKQRNADIMKNMFGD